MFRAARPLLFAGAASVSGAVYSARSKPFQLEEAAPRREKLSIYPKPEPEVVLVETHTALEKHIGIAREAVTSTYLDGESKVKSAVDKWIGVEHAVEKQVKAIIPPDEPMTPGLLYVGVATLTGSVIGRNRSLPIRFILPPTFLLLSLAQFLPKTTSNLSAYYGGLEQKYAPGVASARTELSKTLSSSFDNATTGYKNAKVSVVDKVRWARSEVEGKTGLKVSDVESSLSQTGAQVVSATQKFGSDLIEQVQELKTRTESAVEKPDEKVAVVEEPKRLV